MSVFIFAQEGDFERSSAGSLRGADDLQAVRQDLLHILDEFDAVGDAMTGELDDTIRATIIDALSDHPFVSSVDGVDGVADGESNNWTVSVYINGSGDPLSVTTGG